MSQLTLSSTVTHTTDVTVTTSRMSNGAAHDLANGDDCDVTDERAALLDAECALSDGGSSWEGSRRSFYEAAIAPVLEMAPSFDEGSVRGSVFNLSSATLGAGALSVPYAFKSMGIGLGLVLIIICAFATSFSIKLLIMTRTRTGLSSFEQVTARLYGSNAAAAVETSIAVFCFGSGVAYCKTIRDFVSPIIELYRIDQRFPDYDVEKCTMVLVWLCLLLPLSLIRDINQLRYCSLLSVITIIYLSIAISQHALNNVLSGHIHPRWDSLEIWVNLNVLDIISALPIFLFAFTCQINVFAIFDGLARCSDPRMDKVTFRAVALCFIIYSSIGLLGFVEFGSGTCGNILKNYTQEFKDGNTIAVTMYASVAATIIMSFPLVVQPCRSAFDALFARCLPPADRHGIYTVIISGGSLFVSLYVPHINEVFQLLGGTCSSFVCYVLPAMFAIKLQLFAHRPFMNAMTYLLAFMGALAGVLSTGVTLYGFAHPSRGGPSQCD
mmetsp:Transcript_12185/g.19297  ORF Transcript_12185/g.19297 Transcript_12185/m.19297 type:complete len:496 (-) Transcript_12185:35-1522(-)